jgi:small subunit ribosomal protein S2
MATTTEVGIRELLEAGVHFGHQTRRWNPKMRRFIHGEREGIYIIDLLQTEQLLKRAMDFAEGIARRGGTILFVGTKKQARDSVEEVASSCGMPYIQNRWLGGVLTNFQTINQRIKRLHDLERFETDGSLALLPTQERMAAQADLAKLRSNLGGVKNMQRTPDAIFIVDLKTEVIAVREAQRLRIPIIGLVDTNCDPDGIDYVIPGNDDAIRSCSLILRAIGESINRGRSVWQQAEQERLQREGGEGAPPAWVGGCRAPRVRARRRRAGAQGRRGAGRPRGRRAPRGPPGRGRRDAEGQPSDRGQRPRRTGQAAPGPDGLRGPSPAPHRRARQAQEGPGRARRGGPQRRHGGRDHARGRRRPAGEVPDACRSGHGQDDQGRPRPDRRRPRGGPQGVPGGRCRRRRQRAGARDARPAGDQDRKWLRSPHRSSSSSATAPAPG